jgi:hypothetical protein
MLLEEHKQVLRMRYLLNSRDAAALEQLEHDDSSAYLDALTAEVEAGDSAPLPQPADANPATSPPGQDGPESSSSASNVTNFHG